MFCAIAHVKQFINLFFACLLRLKDCRMTKAIVVKNFSLQHNKKYLVKNLSFQVAPQKIFLLLGPSGSGKTTLLETILGFRSLQKIEHKTEEIDILVKGRSLKASGNENFLRSSIAWLPQEIPFHEQKVEETFIKILNFSVNRFLKQNFKYKEKTFKDFAVQLSLNDSAWQKTFAQLSGGEKQKVMLILCAMLKRPIWLLDEPGSALDKASLLLLVSFLKKQKAAMIISTHSPLLMQSFNDKIFLEKIND